MVLLRGQMCIDMSLLQTEFSMALDGDTSEHVAIDESWKTRTFTPRIA